MPTLLLADDSLTIRRVIELTFADEGITVVTAADGDEAIRRIEAAPPDIVLADTGMPGRTGYEVAEHVKRSPRLAHIPVVLLTGAFEPLDQARVGRGGCDGVLAKPFEPQVVVARVRELLGRPAGRPTPLARDPVAPPPPRAALNPVVLDRYFDQLHQAFTDASGPPAREPSAIDWGHSKEPQMTNPTPPLADAFAALLAAEQREPLSGLPSSWPGSGGSVSPAVVDEAARKVLDQLSDKAVREAVTKAVSQAAEKLVREEIERIKSSIR